MTCGAHTTSCGLEARLRAVVAEHLEPRWGSAFWLQRAEQAGIRTDDIRTLDDLTRLGSTSTDDLQSVPLLHHVPRRHHDRLDRLVIGQTNGTTRGAAGGTWTAYLEDEFHEAFVTPFVEAARHVGFPQGLPWLFVGPSGPHVIGKAAAAIARATGSAEPFTVDFDPRWARRLPSGSMPAQRYLGHVVEQALAVLEAQAIGVLFATPPVLLELARRLRPSRRAAIRGVHYGGMPLDADARRTLQCEAFPDAVHLAGYGNTLMGCCLELSTSADRELDYFPFGDRLHLEVLDGDGAPAGEGRVRLTRLDRAMLVVRLPERDHARLVPPPASAPRGFHRPGLRDPRTPTGPAGPRVATLY